MEIDFLKRLEEYDKDHCWQYQMRIDNLGDDLSDFRIDVDTARNLTVSDFSYHLITDDKAKQDAIRFIKKHEWLGNISQFTTHWFGCYYNGILAGVILFNVPNAFSKLVGVETPKLERLISRGACISWSPKNLASSFLMWCINYMIQNTPFRVFTAYSDPSAKELGTIYQACNFMYLGQKSGGTKKYINPYSGKLVSDRYFRQKTAYKKYAGEMGIEWQSNWSHKTGMSWQNIPDDIELKLRQYSRDKQNDAQLYTFPSKHKYIYIKGRNKTETKDLKKLFNAKTYPYPKERGK